MHDTSVEMCADAFILAGGHSRRFGENKALYRVAGRPLIQRPIDCLSGFFPSVHVIAKETVDYEHLGVAVIQDADDQQTPLVGVLSGLEAASTRWSFFMACDMPLMRPRVMQALYRALDSASGSGAVDAVVPVTAEGPQPLAAFYANTGIDALRWAVRKKRSMKAWLEALHVRTVRFEDAGPFRNVNRKRDLPPVAHGDLTLAGAAPSRELSRK